MCCKVLIVDFCWKTESSNLKMFCSLIHINPFAIQRENRAVSLLINLCAFDGGETRGNTDRHELNAEGLLTGDGALNISDVQTKIAAAAMTRLPLTAYLYMCHRNEGTTEKQDLLLHKPTPLPELG